MSTVNVRAELARTREALDLERRRNALLDDLLNQALNLLSRRTTPADTREQIAFLRRAQHAQKRGVR